MKSNLYEIYQERKNEILSIAEMQESVASALKIDKLQSQVRGVIERLKVDVLRVLIVGRFNAGKSTFVNSLFGEPVLPVAPIPCTGVLTEVKYSPEDKKRATLYPKKGQGENGDDSPFEVKIENVQTELNKYVKIDHFSGSKVTSRFQKVELFWPLKLCSNGIELIDSVGLDDPESREDITLEYAQFADVIVYCMKSIDAYSAKDRQVLGLLKSLRHESIFFIITYFDFLKQACNNDNEDLQKNLQYYQQCLSDWTELGTAGIKYLDGKTALEGKVSGDQELIVSSGLKEIEESLESFLVQEKGRAKLLINLSSLRDVNRSVRKIIPSRISMLQENIEDIEERYKNAELPLRNLEAQQKLIVGQVENKITDIARDSYDLADSYFLDLPDKIQKWAMDYEIEQGVGFPPRKKTIKLIVEELVNYLKDEIKGDVAEWNASDLSPMIESKITQMQDFLDKHASAFLDAIDELRIKITLGDQLGIEDIAEEEKPSAFGRLCAGGYTILTGDFITGGLGMTLGIKAMLNTIICEVVIGVIIGIVGIINPVTLIGGLVMAVLGGNFLNTLSIKKDIKTKVSKKLSEEIGKRRNKLSRKVESEIQSKLTVIRDAINDDLSAKLDSVRDEVETMIKQRKQGKLNAKREIDRLRKIEKQNTDIEDKLDSLLCEAELFEA